MIHIGNVGGAGKLLLDPISGVVWEEHGGRINKHPVNASLDAFNRCVETLLVVLQEAYSRGEEREDEDVAIEFEQKVHEIDPLSNGVDSFWYEIRWGIAIGDFEDADFLQD